RRDQRHADAGDRRGGRVVAGPGHRPERRRAGDPVHRRPADRRAAGARLRLRPAPPALGRMSERPLWTQPVGRRSVLLAAGAVAGTAALPAGRAGAVTRTTSRAAATAQVDAISAGSWLAGDTHVHDDHSS